MNDYTARLLDEDRAAHFEPEAANASRLAWEAHHAQRRGRLPAVSRELLGPSFTGWAPRQVHRGLQKTRVG